MVEIFESKVLSPVSLTLATNFSLVSLTLALTLSPVSMTLVINGRFAKVIDVTLVIDPDNDFLTKVVDIGRQFISHIIDTDEKCITGDCEGYE